MENSGKKSLFIIRRKSMEGNVQSKFYNQLNVSERTRRNYEKAINSSFIKIHLLKYFQLNDLFAITDIEQLWNFYSIINIHPTNIQNHRLYSAAINKYIRFLNDGNKYGRRRDYKTHRANKVANV